MTSRRASLAALLGLAVVLTVVPGFAKGGKTVMTHPIVTTDAHHDTGPLLREIAPLLPEYNIRSSHEIENNEDPRFKEWNNRPYPVDTVLQRPENSPTAQTPPPTLIFDALGFGDNFYCDCMPADNDGAPGTTQYVEFINTEYAVYSKSGTLLLGPLAGNSFWSGFGGGCEKDDWGDPIVRFDAAAKRWVASQFDLGASGNGPYAECVAVSTTDDATGSYNRYRFKMNQFPDYPKMGVWPDGYYFSYNINGSSEKVCATDRTAMLAGNTATQICFSPNGQFGMLPSDLDGANPPAAGTPNFFLELQRYGGANLSMYAFHADFSNPSNSTFTGPTNIPIAAYKPACPGARMAACAPQPDVGSDQLETISDRLMYRLVYRNFGDHTVLLTAHSVQVNGTGSGVRWYEIRNPETSPILFQSGTFSPDSQYRFMPAIAMDQNQNIAVGFTRSGSGAGQYPSLVYAGRVPTDPTGTLESEVTMLAGTGSQSSGGLDRWGDYSSLTVDPTDDCTFWFSESYIKSTGENQGLNWSTGIGTFNFPGCTGGGPTISITPTSLEFRKVLVGQTEGKKKVVLTNTGNADLKISTVVATGDFALVPVMQTKKITPCVNGSVVHAGATCVIKVTFTPSQTGTRTGAVNFTDNAPNSPQSVALSGTGK
ncbi:MAG TPA: choice-of-anchor D domain-containing protein [Terriglobales bacterium]|nr:choice-of-anchor D domain-containing protein [Terriglobales bacterium]